MALLTRYVTVSGPNGPTILPPGELPEWAKGLVDDAHVIDTDPEPEQGDDDAEQGDDDEQGEAKAPAQRRRR